MVIIGRRAAATLCAVMPGNGITLSVPLEWVAPSWETGITIISAPLQGSPGIIEDIWTIVAIGARTARLTDQVTGSSTIFLGGDWLNRGPGTKWLQLGPSGLPALFLGDGNSHQLDSIWSLSVS